MSISYLILQIQKKTEYISIDEGAKKNCFVVVVDNFLGYSNI